MNGEVIVKFAQSLRGQAIEQPSRIRKARKLYNAMIDKPPLAYRAMRGRC